MFTLAPSSHLMVPVRMVSATFRSCSDRVTSVSSLMGLASSTLLMMRLGTTFCTTFLPVVLAAGCFGEVLAALVWASAANGNARAVAAIRAIVFMMRSFGGGFQGMAGAN